MTLFDSFISTTGLRYRGGAMWQGMSYRYIFQRTRHSWVIFRILSQIIVTFPILSFGAYAMSPAGCRQPTAESVKKAQTYIAKRLNRDVGQIVLTPGNPLPEEMCFIPLTASDTVTQEKFVLYLSDDGRMLTSELYDLDRAPAPNGGDAVDRAPVDPRDFKTVAKLLREDDGAVRGSSDRAVEVVVFVDFQCPFCRRMETVLDSIASEEHPNIRLIYRAYPLTIHPWAMEAATLAACVQLQNTDSFWNLYGKLFDNQANITPDNLRSLVDMWLKSDKNIDRKVLDQCLSSNQGRSLVDRDISLGKRVGVRATPTTFINGSALEGASDRGTLMDLIQSASPVASGSDPALGGSSKNALVKEEEESLQ